MRPGYGAGVKQKDNYLQGHDMDSSTLNRLMGLLDTVLNNVKGKEMDKESRELILALTHKIQAEILRNA